MASSLRKMTHRVEEATAVLGVSKSKIYDSISSGELRAVQLGRRVVIPGDVIETLVGPLPGSEDCLPSSSARPVTPHADSSADEKWRRMQST